MRTKTLLLSAAVGAAGMLAASAQVYSVNSVGYVNVSLTTAGFHLIANPLNTSDNTVAGLFADTLPIGTTIYKWDGATFVSSTYLGIWSDAAMTLNPGEGAFISVGGQTTLTFVGEVMQGNLSNSLPAGFSLKSSQVPQEAGLDALGFPADVGDTIYFWDQALNGGAGTYVGFTYLGVWSPSVPTPKVGESFFVSVASAKDWTRTFSVNN